MKVLVTYYSRTGNTRRVARRIARDLDADVEEIEDATDRSGVIGFMRGGKDALFHNTTKMGELEKTPEEYDLVVVGTPVWAGTMCPAVRSWLQRFSGQLPRSAFFLTTRMSGKEKTFTDMAEVGGTAPEQTLALTVSELRGEEWIQRVEQFVEQVRS